jgi:hypothetical protein
MSIANDADILAVVISSHSSPRPDNFLTNSASNPLSPYSNSDFTLHKICGVTNIRAIAQVRWKDQVASGTDIVA